MEADRSGAMIGAVKTGHPVSWWLETCDDDLTPRPPLDGSTTADVAIMGAGFTGLWTALSLLERDPSLKVVVVEREIAGWGASGRNGGWLSPEISVSHTELAARHGLDATRATHDALVDTIGEVEAAVERHGIDAHLDRHGGLMLARGGHQLATLRRIHEEMAEIGRPDFYRWLEPDEVAEMVRVDNTSAGLFAEPFAAIHPGRLVRGLARAVERLGGTIHEQTEVTGYTTGTEPALHTTRGTMDAHVVVLAGEAYLSQLEGHQREVLPVYSQIMLTAPLTEAQRAEIGWRKRFVMQSKRLTIDYLQITRDGRIAFGGRGSMYHWGSAIKPEWDCVEDTARSLREQFEDFFPTLADVPFERCWGGVVGIHRDWMPSFRYDRESGLAKAGGYAGEGVAASNLAGRTLADLITGGGTALCELPMVQHEPKRWEPEPFRWLGVRHIQKASARLEDKAIRTGRPPSGRSLAERLMSH
jgi:glycine/D-amino acid oxidase-like deaminating enzyme